MDELWIHRRLCWGLITLGLLTFVYLRFFPAAYGRHRSERRSFCVSNRAGWILMEFPAVFLFLGIFAMGSHANRAQAWVLAGIWMAHYAYRSLVYPFRITYAPRRMPLEIALAGFVFQSLNAYLNARWISHLHLYTWGWFSSWQFVVGTLIFLVALTWTLRSDEIVLRLKRSSPDRYQIPRGGLFRWVSSPNYLCEIVEWGAWATLTWSISGLAFFLYVIANLAPRALAHHRWYHERFPDYPPERKALLPGLI